MRILLYSTFTLIHRFPVPIGVQKHVGRSYEEARASYIQALEDSRSRGALSRQAIVAYVEQAVLSFLYDLYWCYALV